MNSMGLAVILLAAGKGTRMKSSLAKVLHLLNNEPILSHVLKSLSPLSFDLSIVIIGFQSEAVKAAFSGRDLLFVEQKEQLGTGHAVQQAVYSLKDFSGDILVVCGDMPLIKSKTLIDLVNKHQREAAQCTILTLKTEEKKDFGRIIRNQVGGVAKIVEHCDASEDEKEVDEFNTGVYCFNKDILYKALGSICDKNVQKEYYLTDTIEYIVEAGFRVEALQSKDSAEFLGVNSQEDLRLAEQILVKHTGSS